MNAHGVIEESVKLSKKENNLKTLMDYIEILKFLKVATVITVIECDFLCCLIPSILRIYLMSLVSICSIESFMHEVCPNWMDGWMDG